MERHNALGLGWACSHGQYTLDEHDCDTLHHVIGTLRFARCHVHVCIDHVTFLVFHVE